MNKNKNAGKRKTAKQLSFFKPAPRQFGGSLLKGNPKEQRPLSTKKPLHLVLKSKWAFGDKSMLSRQNIKNVDYIIRKQAKACGIKLYHLVNVGNHLHLVVKIEDRKLYRNFIRAVSGLIARQVLQKQRGPEKAEAEGAAKKSKSFWLARPFTRIASWGRDYENLKKYMLKNLNQARRFGAKVSDHVGNQVLGFDIPVSFQNTA